MGYRKLPNGSFVTGRLPMSCVMCQQGAKMVLLVTGKCQHACFYCPLSLKKRGRGVIYADELQVRSDDDVLFEARAIGARGTGITGGDPLLAMDKTLHHIWLLKEELGNRHNIHLYTATPDRSKVRKLAEAGLDEIRFHPPPESWGNLPGSDFLRVAGDALDLGLKVGFEIPSIPGMGSEMTVLAMAVAGEGAQFLNLNELEFSEGNWDALLEMGFRVKDDVSSAAAGSMEAAEAVAEAAGDIISVHFCSSSFKDATQLRNRLLRRARNTATGLEIITDEGMFLKGVIETPEPEKLVRSLRRRFSIPPNLIRHDKEKSRVEVAAWVLEELADEMPSEKFLVWEYPTADRLEVERQPL